MSATRDRIRVLVAEGAFVASLHGYDALDDNGIVFSDLVESLNDAEIVEDYPDAKRGPSVLLLHAVPRGKLHAVWGIPAGRSSPAVLITAYRPDPARWTPDLMTRRRA